MTITSVNLDPRTELQYVFVSTSDEIPLDTYVELNGEKALSCVYVPPADASQSPIVSPNGSIGFSYLNTTWNFGDSFTLVNSQGSQVVSNYNN